MPRRRPRPTAARTGYPWRRRRPPPSSRRASPWSRSIARRSASACCHRPTISSRRIPRPRRSSRGSGRPRRKMEVNSGALPARHWIISALLAISDAVAAILLAADLLVVCVSVLLRFLLNAPVEWSDDVARGLMVGSSFFGAASALARSENAGVAFFVDRVPGGTRRIIDATTGLIVLIICGYVAFHTISMGMLTTGQTTGSGLPLELTFYPMGVGALFMTV